MGRLFEIRMWIMLTFFCRSRRPDVSRVVSGPLILNIVNRNAHK